ncbi:RNA-binding S4 domain-containing protein [Arcanobacterium pinnipediorum]|uniref:RNA-binding S4 domain-containing protein n=1 Tax=Arcanobacterium pinnipediorum TaxID=1503041 RepID=A0ABY5AIJ4_9ACTO|nr:RNA-binding S4 domain-containing protein [Arcanobacterium pinnipediorum]USR80042.1 RNA-binding S4 domain-containing protein [Arcanobacterium pinnipediorum]
MIEEFDVRLPIQLGQFVKLAGLADTGGQARELILNEQVYVNGELNTHRSAKLTDGDLVEVRYAGQKPLRARVVSR